MRNVIPVLGRIVSGSSPASRSFGVYAYAQVVQQDSRTKKVAAACTTTHGHRIGMQLVQERKVEIVRKYGEPEGAVEKRDVQGRDLALLIKANMATDIPDDQRLTDEEILARASIPIFSMFLRIDSRLQRCPHSLLQETRPQAQQPPGAYTHCASTLICRNDCARNC